MTEGPALAMQPRLARSVIPAGAAAGAAGEPGDEAVDFVRFCRRRRRVAWPELYDEMCAVAGRRAYRDWGFAELSDHGISFTLGDMPGLAALVREVIGEERTAS